MRLLLELGADPTLTNADRCSPLLAAAGIGTLAPGEEAGTEDEALEAVRLLLELGADINAVDDNGETAMHGAAYKSLPEDGPASGRPWGGRRSLEPEEQIRMDTPADRPGLSPGQLQAGPSDDRGHSSCPAGRWGRTSRALHTRGEERRCILAQVNWRRKRQNDRLSQT